MTDHAVVIVGGGPTGLMLAGELALAGIDVVIVEKRQNQDLVATRAGTVPAPSALLVRPDGYVAWVGTGDGAHTGLADALTMWFGAPTG